MSRIGRKPIAIPAGVTVTVDGNNITVAGPKGTLNSTVNPLMTVAVEGATVVVSRPDDEAKSRSLHGLTRTLIANMVEGVLNGYSRALEIQGIGYRVQKQGNQAVFNIGFSHPVVIDEVPGITINVTSQTPFTVSGPDKQLVGQIAATIRDKKPPEPYHGKGIRYVGEHVRMKEGKAGKGSKK